MSSDNYSGSRPSSRGGSSSRSSRPSSGGRPSSGSRGGSSSSRPGSSRGGSSSSRPSSGSYRDSATSGGRTASGRDSADRSSYSGRPGRPTSSRPGSSRPSSDRGERSYGARDSRPSSDRPSRSYGDRPDRGRPSEGRSDDRRSYGSRDSRSTQGRATDRRDGTSSRSYSDRDSRPSSDRPAGRSYGDRDSRPSSRPSSDRGDRPAGRSYGDRDSRPSSRPSSDRGERSYGSRDSRPSSDRPSRSYGDRPDRRDDRRPTSDRPRRDNPFAGDRPKASDDRRPAGRSYGSRDDRSGRDSRPSRDDRGGSRYSERGGRPDRAGGRFADDREERRGRVGEKRVNQQDPIIPDHITGEELPRAVRNELRTLPEGLALRVARHLAASVEAAAVNPELSWQHAKAALSKASRVGIIREAAAEAAYNAGHYAEALIEFRAARRMRGIKEYWPLMADCERACGRPKKAIEMAGDPLVKNLDHASRVEMRIVAAGARMDLGNMEAALATLQCPDLTANSIEPWAARIRYTYADVLEQLGRKEEALEWFHRAAAVDADEATDSNKRIRILEGKSSADLDDDEYTGYEDLEDSDEFEGEYVEDENTY